VIDWRAIARTIAEVSGEGFDPRPPDSVGGGCINQALRLVDGERSWFVKVNTPGKLDMFEAEQAGLEAMHATATLRVPRPLCTGATAGHSFIVMEYIPFGAAGSGGHRRGGEQLAAMHRHTASRFGWERDNTIGSTPQPNAWREAWVDFWREHRLGFQLRLAARNGHGGRLQQLGERLLEGFPVLIDHAPAPSLLHGDLWGGNFGFDAAGEPVVFDPAAYYGDREAELAMTELFGGFSRDFYAAYEAAWPLDAGYGVRRTLYNLYHVLNHLNLFGGGYAGQAESMISRLLAEL
jgi:fructosamine-3-kinase